MSILTLFGKLVNNLSQSQITQLIEDKKTLSAQVDHLKKLRAAEFKILCAATDTIASLMEDKDVSAATDMEKAGLYDARDMALNEADVYRIGLNNANAKITELAKDMETLVESRSMAYKTNHDLLVALKTLQDENVAMKTQHAANAVKFMKDPLASLDWPPIGLAPKPIANATLIARTAKNGNQHAEFLMDNDFGRPVMACERFAITRVEA